MIAGTGISQSMARLLPPTMAEGGVLSGAIEHSYSCGTWEIPSSLLVRRLEVPIEALDSVKPEGT